ncbi:MAG: hypothetical protein ETSY2_30730 [Candidatus Entotheonella gemina]|uniref:FAD-binding domain-containing protein n=1 Tax=Candidatus Entotheonella gemina TaxID=1429439 RepID=W4M1M9_9BACT|nr:MAG: hypothetical protein ETSY2_30730 [Candidatus Entotheonella gemina]
MAVDTIPRTTEICVIGGGPAGSAAACKLAMLGHEVCLVEREGFPRPHIGESLPPSILPLLDRIGVRQRIEAAGFLRSQQAIVHWAHTAPWEKHQPGEPGFQVDRGRFDQLLLDHAADASVTVLQPAKVMRPVRESNQLWQMPVRHDGQVKLMRARFIVDASGKRSVLPRTKRRISAPTIAIYAYWRHTGLQGSATRVEAGSNAWFWGAPLPDGTFNATVFVDPERCAAVGRGGLPHVYQALLADSTLLHGCLQGERASAVQACDASSYHVTPSISDHWIKIGEAAFAIDPLSSQGVQTAIRTGLQGAIAVHTILHAPANTADAMAFYRDRQAESVAHHQQLAAQFYAEQNRFCSESFWQKRMLKAATLKEPEDDRRQVVRLEMAQPLRFSSDSKLVKTPVLKEDLISSQFALMHPALHRPVAFINGYQIVPLLMTIRNGHTVAAILQGWSNHLPLHISRDILEWLCTMGILVDDLSRRPIASAP